MNVHCERLFKFTVEMKKTMKLRNKMSKEKKERQHFGGEELKKLERKTKVLRVCMRVV